MFYQDLIFAIVVIIILATFISSFFIWPLSCEEEMSDQEKHAW